MKDIDHLIWSGILILLVMSAIGNYNGLLNRCIFGWIYPDNRLETFLMPWICLSLGVVTFPVISFHVILSSSLFIYSFLRVDRFSITLEGRTTRPQWMERFSVLSLVILWLLSTVSAFYTAASFVLIFSPDLGHLIEEHEDVLPSPLMIQVWKIASWITAGSSILFSLQFAWWIQRKLVFALALALVPFQIWIWTTWVLMGALF